MEDPSYHLLKHSSAVSLSRLIPPDDDKKQLQPKKEMSIIFQKNLVIHLLQGLRGCRRPPAQCLPRRSLLQTLNQAKLKY